MKIYLKILSILYAVGAIIHLADLLSLRMDFPSMEPRWKFLTIFLLVMDSVAAIGLWKQRRWGIWSFLIVAAYELMCFIGFSDLYPNQTFLILFHIVTVGLYFVLKLRTSRYSNVGSHKY